MRLRPGPSPTAAEPSGHSARITRNTERLAPGPRGKGHLDRGRAFSWPLLSTQNTDEVNKDPRRAVSLQRRGLRPEFSGAKREA